jgi:hypothetical protein
MEKPRYWFAAKRYGWGWGLPLTWEGWVVFAVWMAIFLTAVPLLRSPGHALAHAFFVFAMVAALFGVCYWRGEPPRWRWGD